MNIDVIKKGDTYPPLSFEFVDDNNDYVDCAPYEVRLVVKNKKNEIVIDSIIGGENSAGEWTDVTKGIGKYQWQENDTSTIGRYLYEFKFKRLYDGYTFSIPEQDYFQYGVVENIDTNN